MKNTPHRRRSAYRGDVMAVLASARPASLTADATQRDAWSSATQITDAGPTSDAGPAADDNPIHGQLGCLQRWRWPAAPTKLLAAMSSAVVTAVVIVIAVVVGTVVLRAPHRQPPVVSSTTRPLVFYRLPLSPRWNGAVEYAVSNGVVYLEGIATPDSPGRQPGPVAKLPPGVRPAAQLDLAAVVSAGAGTIEIGADGRIAVVAARGGKVTSVSLAGVAFPVGSR
jgi:hypothetical protein